MSFWNVPYVRSRGWQNFSGAFSRLIWRGLCGFGYLYFTYKIKWTIACYYALLNDVVCIVYHNIFLTSISRPILLKTIQIVPSVFWNGILCEIIVHTTVILLYFAVMKFMPLDRIEKVTPLRIGVLAVISILSYYSNGTLRSITDHETSVINELSVYSIILQITLLFCLIFMEQFLYNLQSSTNARIQLVQVESILNSVEKNQQKDLAVRKAYHDLNNHMTALQYLLGTDQHEKALNYVDDLLGTISQRVSDIRTGRTLLDGLLAEKSFFAAENGIEMMVTADLRRLNSIDDVDICIIFGNALDNAIEACQKIEDKNERFIHIKNIVLPEHMLLDISNSFSGEFKLENTHFATTKKDSENHGFGLKNIRSSIRNTVEQ